MVTTVTAIATVAVLGVWHLHTRRHPAWTLSAPARFFFGLAYPMAAIAIYFLIGSPGTPLGWVFGILWASAATAMFVVGFTALTRVLHRQHATALSLETIPHTVEV